MHISDLHLIVLGFDHGSEVISVRLLPLFVWLWHFGLIVSICLETIICFGSLRTGGSIVVQW
jgi:hypothetical protein